MVEFGIQNLYSNFIIQNVKFVFHILKFKIQIYILDRTIII